MENRIQNYDNGTKVIAELEQRIETDSEYQLPDPPALMSAKSYKQKFVEPLIKKFKAIIKEVFVRYFQAKDDYHRLNVTNANLYRENERLGKKTMKNSLLKMEICVQKTGITNCSARFSAVSKLITCLSRQER